MRGKLGRAGWRKASRCLAACLLLLAGCTGVPGALGVTGLAPGNRLTDTARDLRQPPPATLGLPRELDKRPLPPYTVEPGDVLLVQPADLDSPVRLPGDQPVLPDGTINLGRYGSLQVAGKTVPEIETLVRAAVQAHAEGAGPVTVRLVSRQSKVFYVLGEVNAPGAFPLNGRETVLDGILAAGGLNDRASRSDIVLSRPTRPGECRVVLPVCYEEIVQLGDTTTNYQLAPGDRIYVAGKCMLEHLLGDKPRKNGPCGGPQVPCELSPDHGDDPPAPVGPASRAGPGPVPLGSRHLRPELPALGQSQAAHKVQRASWRQWTSAP